MKEMSKETMEQIIKSRNREAFYEYYRSLGYSHKTAAVLALFTYGRHKYSRLSIDALYQSLYEGEGLSFHLEEEQASGIPGRLRALFSRPSPNRPSSAFDGSAKAPSAAPVSRSTSGCAAPVSQSRSGPAAPFSADVDGPDMMTTAFYSGTSLPSAPSSSAKSARMGMMGSPAAGAPLPSVSPSRGSRMSTPPGTYYSGEITTAYMPSREASIFRAAPGFATDEYEHIEEKEERTVAAEPTSTFRMTTNTASAGVILNQLRNGRRIDRSMVRIEEMLNYFRYDSELPEEEMFRISYELMNKGDDRRYLYINVQGRREVRERQNIVILLDVSGSMTSNAQITQAAAASIISKLGNGDRLSLVTYSSADTVVLEGFSVKNEADRDRILEKLLSIEISGYTNGSGGIEAAYNIGKKNYIRGGNNQIILITDGDLNFGITDKGGLEELIERKKKNNLFLSVIGTGLYNYKDDKLETLAKHGNGVYRVVNSLTDVRKSIDEEYASLVNIIAKDVKAQVEFNPEIVESYRLLGFENRGLAREDFTNDKVISEPFGSGGYGVALYELKIRTADAPVESGLKYSRLTTTGSSEPATIRIRFKEPLAEQSHEQEKVIEKADASFSDNLRLAFIVYVCSEKLRGSDKINTEDILLARRLYKELGEPIRRKNAADLYKLAGLLDKSDAELGIGIPEEPFLW